MAPRLQSPPQVQLLQHGVLHTPLGSCALVELPMPQSRALPVQHAAPTPHHKLAVYCIMAQDDKLYAPTYGFISLVALVQGTLLHSQRP